MQETYEVSPGIFFPVSGYARVVDENKRPTGETIPIVDIPMMSDYKWQEECLKSRLEHPERYEKSEDVQAVIEKIKRWLADHAGEKGVA